MDKARRMLVMGLGAVTPAFVAADGAQASSVASGTPAVASDQQALKSGLLALTASMVFALTAAPEARLAASDRITVSDVYWDDQVVGSSTLVRTPNGLSFTYHTSGLPAGYAFTLWIVVFNNPKA